MSEIKHTPGPWSLVKLRTLVHIMPNVCQISVSANHVHEDYPGRKVEHSLRQEANARLIAAAPDLLEALKAAEQNFVKLYNAISPTGRHESGNRFADNDPVVSLVREVISKAEGRT